MLISELAVGTYLVRTLQGYRVMKFISNYNRLIANQRDMVVLQNVENIVNRSLMRFSLLQRNLLNRKPLMCSSHCK